MTFLFSVAYNMNMEKRFLENKIEYVYEGEALAYVRFSKDNSRLLIQSTYVDSSLRGQGVAKKLMEDILAMAEAEKLRIQSECSYASSYFASHPTPLFKG